MPNQTSPENVSEPDFEALRNSLTDDQRELVTMYETVEWLPDITAEMKEVKEQELEVADTIARETGHETEIPVLRFVALMQIENAKRIAGIGASKIKLNNEPIVIDLTDKTQQAQQAQASVRPTKPDMLLPKLKSAQALATLQRMGVLLVDGGGSHQKIYYPETGVTTVIPSGHKGKEINSYTLKGILGQLGIPVDKFKTYI